MSGTQQTQAQPKRDGLPPADQQTWEGGGREPIDPDDVGEDGENAGEWQTDEAATAFRR